MHRIFIYFRDMFLAVWINRRLIKTLAKRDIQSRYRGSIVGLTWAFLNPIILLCTYTFIFSVVFQAKWNSQVSSKSEFAMVIFSGMIIYNMFAECIGRAPMLILTNANYVKKVIFPFEILPIVNIVAALFHAFISFMIWIFFYFIFIGIPHVSVLLIFLIAIPLLLYTAGFSWLLASLGVFLRDIIQIVTLILTVLMFVSPVFYPLSAVPENFRSLMLFNPLAGILEQARNVLFDQAPLDWSWLLISGLVSLFIAMLGFMWFQKTRRGFADVI
jgi:ABC-type polysaccharide/polyol phosphate export systems, permease component